MKLTLHAAACGLPSICAAAFLAGSSIAPAESLGLLYQLNGSAIEGRGLGEGIMVGFDADPFVAGQVGPKALAFAGGEFVALPSFYRGDQFQTVSVSIWVNTINPGDQILVSYDRDEYWQLEVNGDLAGDGEIAFGINTNDGVKSVVSTGRVDTGGWHHVMASFDGGTGKLQIHIDGALDSEVTEAAANRYGSGNKRFGFLGVGSNADTMNGTRGTENYLIGSLDDMRVYSGSASGGTTLANEIANVESKTTAADGLRALADRDGDGMSNSWEEENGLDPDDPSDADANADGDLGTNIQEFRAKTDPQTGGDYTPPLPKPTVNVSVVTADAYELEGTPASFQITLNGGSSNLIPVFFTMGTAANLAQGSSDSTDYVVKDTAGNVVSGFIMVAGNGGTAEVVIHPVIDNYAEYPEVVNLTVDYDTGYKPGPSLTETVFIKDATDIADNATTFKGIYTQEGSVVTNAIGFATISINGPKTVATLYSTFSNLNAPQLATGGAHIHKVVNVGTPENPVPDFTQRGGVVMPLPSGLIDGVFQGLFEWSIAPSGGDSVQFLIDSLFRQNGLALYCNVHTDMSQGGDSAGEIRAVFEEFDGAVALSAQDETDYQSVDPAPDLATDDDLYRDASRFLTQATYGPTWDEIEALVAEIKTNPSYDNGDGTYDQVAAYKAWMDDQLDTRDQTRLFDLVYAMDELEYYFDRNLDSIADGGGPLTRNNPVNNEGPREHNAESMIWTLLTHGHDQFRQRIALALSEIVVISRQETDLRNNHMGTSHWWDVLASMAGGSGAWTTSDPAATPWPVPYPAPVGGSTTQHTWKHLLEFSSMSPVMGLYLSHLRNETVKDGSGNIINFPDENYAREIQQLFSLGLLVLLPDGRIQLGSNGQPIQSYDNFDIENLAKVFTGWSWSQWDTDSNYAVAANENNNAHFTRGNGDRWHNQLQWISPMISYDPRHDTDEKYYLRLDPTNQNANKTTDRNHLVAGQSGEADLDQILGILDSHPNLGPFIAKLLIQRFVTSNPSRSYVYRVASVFNGGSNHQTGSSAVNAAGIKGDIRKVVCAILVDPEARSLNIADSREDYGKVREPAIITTHTYRALNCQSKVQLQALSQIASGPNFLVTPGSGNTVVLPITGEDGFWPAQDYPADQLDNFPAGATLLNFDDRLPAFGQAPLNSPTVFNFFLPDYSPGGALSLNNLAAPELEIATETSTVNGPNYHWGYMDANEWINADNVQGSAPGPGATPGGFRNTDDYVWADKGFDDLVAYYSAAPGNSNQKAEALLDRLDLTFACGILKRDYGGDPDPENPRNAILTAIIDTTNLRQKVKTATYLVVHSPAGLGQR